MHLCVFARVPKQVCVGVGDHVWTLPVVVCVGFSLCLCVVWSCLCMRVTRCSVSNVVL